MNKKVASISAYVGMKSGYVGLSENYAYRELPRNDRIALLKQALSLLEKKLHAAQNERPDGKPSTVTGGENGKDTGD